MPRSTALPEPIRDIDHLDVVMALPTQALPDDLRRLDGDILTRGVLFGDPTLPLEHTVDWVATGGPALGKDSHYDARDGAH